MKHTDFYPLSAFPFCYQPFSHVPLIHHYHSMAYGSTHKYVLRIIDHSMIYVAIAGSYTPVVLTLMNNWFGYLIIAIQWGTTIFGILYKIFAKKVNEKFSLALYLIMGWLVLAIIPAIISQTTPIFGVLW